MSAKTSQNLANALREKGFEDLAKRAEADEFHDFLSNHPVPALLLMEELEKTGNKELVERHLNGEFDASLEESEEWWQREGKQMAETHLGPEMVKKVFGK